MRTTKGDKMFETVQYTLCCEKGDTFVSFANMQTLMGGNFPNPQMALSSPTETALSFWKKIKAAWLRENPIT